MRNVYDEKKCWPSRNHRWRISWERFCSRSDSDDGGWCGWINSALSSLLCSTQTPFTYIFQTSSLAPYSPAFRSRKHRASACLPRLAHFQPALRRILVFCVATGLVLHCTPSQTAHAVTEGRTSLHDWHPYTWNDKANKKVSARTLAPFSVKDGSQWWRQNCSTSCHLAEKKCEGRR